MSRYMGVCPGRGVWDLPEAVARVAAELRSGVLREYSELLELRLQSGRVTELRPSYGVCCCDRDLRVASTIYGRNDMAYGQSLDMGSA